MVCNSLAIANNNHCNLESIKVLKFIREDTHESYDRHAKSDNFKFVYIEMDESIELSKLKSEFRCVIGDIFRPTQIYVTEDENVMVAIDGAASESRISFYSTQDCALILSNGGLLYEATVSSNTISLKGGCERGSEGSTVGLCDQSRVYSLDNPKCQPSYLEKESMEYTEKVHGVSFRGTAWVENIGTEKAKIINKPDWALSQE